MARARGFVHVEQIRAATDAIPCAYRSSSARPSPKSPHTASCQPPRRRWTTRRLSEKRHITCDMTLARIFAYRSAKRLLTSSPRGSAGIPSTPTLIGWRAGASHAKSRGTASLSKVASRLLIPGRAYRTSRQRLRISTASLSDGVRGFPHPNHGLVLIGGRFPTSDTRARLSDGARGLLTSKSRPDPCRKSPVRLPIPGRAYRTSRQRLRTNTASLSDVARGLLISNHGAILIESRPCDC